MSRFVMLLAGVLAVGCTVPDAEDVEVDGRGSPDAGLAPSLEANVRGDSVSVVFHVTNMGNDAVGFRFPTSQRYDFVVEDGAGSEVWRWSEGMSFAQALTEAELAPGETWTFEAAWPVGSRSGTHRVTGWITAPDVDVRQSTTFQVP